MSERQSNFITGSIEEDNRTGRFGGRVHTRFPPEPNGWLHIGHAKAITINFSTAEQFGGLYNLRFDDTNPVAEDIEFINAIKKDIRWLGYDWEDRLYYASDYFEQLYQYAVQLIEMSKAYVCDLSQEDMRAYRGTLTEPGTDSPYRNRSVEENLDLFRRMRAGEFPNGARVLRAKIDMASPNIVMRDPVMYRILHATHHRTGDSWCIYPMYDFTHCLSDSIEGITHSLCSLEFENNRALYDWYLDQLELYHPQQIEFARLNLTYTVMSKRLLTQLVSGDYVNGWDDPRMPTLSGMRRRGYTPEAIRNFQQRIGVAKSNSVVDVSMLEHAVREDLNLRSPRVFGVLDPVKLVLINYPEDATEELEAVNNPEDPGAGSRLVPFSREIYIERDDFRLDPPSKYWRLAPGREVRLRYAYLVTCVDVIKDEETGEIMEIHCTYDPETRGGTAPDGRRVRGTLHWVSTRHALPVQIRMYDRLFSTPNPTKADFIQQLNPNSLKVVDKAVVEPSIAEAKPGERFQFERLGYFCVDPDSSSEDLILNRTIALRDTWAKISRKK